MAKDTQRQAAALARALRETGRLSAALRLGGWVLDEVVPSGGTLRSAARAMHLAPSTLQRYVSITQLCRRLERDAFENLGVSHLKLVLSLPRDQQVALVAQADAEGWTVARLRRAIQASSGTGRAQACAERLVAWVASPRRDADLDGDPATLTEMLCWIRTLRADLDRLEAHLEARQRATLEVRSKR